MKAARRPRPRHELVRGKNSGFFRKSVFDQAWAKLERGEAVVVVAINAPRALIKLKLNPALYEVLDDGPVDATDPANQARRYRVRAR